MGADPQAMLFYGYPLPALVVDYHELNDAWEKDHRPAEPTDKSDWKTPEWEEWRVRLREWRESLENVRIGWSGSEDCEQYFIHCEGLQKSVEWNELLAVSQYDLEEPMQAKKLLHDFCDRFNLPKNEPKWYLAARYF